MTNNQIDSNQEPDDNQLADKELEQVADTYKDFADGGLKPDQCQK